MLSLSVAYILRTENIFLRRSDYYFPQKPLDRLPRLLPYWDEDLSLLSRSLFSHAVFLTFSLPLIIYFISLFLASLLRYTIVFYIKSFFP